MTTTSQVINITAERLELLLTLTRGIDALELGPDPQATLAAWKPPEDLPWSERKEQLRQYYVNMDKRLFVVVYHTYWHRAVFGKRS
jgi:hypothetical protein